MTEPSAVLLARAAMSQGREALAANDMKAALRWLDRAHRLVPRDPNIALALASACLPGDPARAAALFLRITQQHDVRQAWFGLAAARLRLAGPQAAAAPLAVALSRHAFMPDIVGLADAIAQPPGGTGWCALRSDGCLELHFPAPKPVRVLLDGQPIRGTALPVGWERCRTIDIRLDDVPLLGSPIQVAAIRRLAGCVEVRDGGLHGWAWHPGDPHTAPVLTLIHPAGRWKQTLSPIDETVAVPDTGPLARPRSFSLTRAQLPEAAGPIHILGPDGSEMSGSPLDPYAGHAALPAAASGLARQNPAGPASPAHATLEARATLPVSAPMLARPVGADGRHRAVTVVVPVHDDAENALACVASVLASVPAETSILVVDDGSSDPVLVAALNDLVGRRRLRLLRHDRAQGFPAGANAGIHAAKGRDVVLLASGTLVPPGWLERLRAAAYSSRDIGTVTPLSNDASILSYPGPPGGDLALHQQEVNRLDRLAARANGAALVDIPASAGGCLYLRRDCLNAVGVFRAGLFAQGDGETTDFCLQARSLGWRSVALIGLFAGHLHSAAYDSSAIHLRARNRRIIERLHPGHHALVARLLAAGPLAAARRRIDLLAWQGRARQWPAAAILVTHNDGGGVEQRVIHAAGGHAAAKRRPIVLRPAETAAGEPAIAVHDGIAGDLRNLIYAIPRELPALLRMLRAAKPEVVEAHHLALYPPAIYQLIARLGVPHEVHIHDYAWFCPRFSLVDGYDRYCGEPDLSGCQSCIERHGHFMAEKISVATLLDRSAGFLSAARRVIVPSDDTATRMRRHFDGLTTSTVHHDDDTARAPAVLTNVRRGARSIVCVAGAIGIHKGYDVLLACARDAVARDLGLEFVVVGHTIDDARLMATERVFVTGYYAPDEAVGLIAAQHASLGFVPSIWPETWCLSLGDIWCAGLTAVAFDIGAPAERIRGNGRGMLLPVGLPAGAINDALIAVMRLVPHQ